MSAKLQASTNLDIGSTTSLGREGGEQKPSVLRVPRLKRSARYSYVLCGWPTQSDIPFTCVPRSARVSKDPEVVIKRLFGRPPMIEGATQLVFQHSEKRSCVLVKGIAQFEVDKGREIRVWLAAGAAQKDVEIFLLGPVWAALCHQRGVLPLHASAVLCKHGIVAFAGNRGTGKSTTAASMGLLGYDVLADDMLPVSFDQNLEPGAWPYLRRLKLKSDALTNLELTSTEVVSDTLDADKFFVHPSRQSRDMWAKLHRVYVLENDPSASALSVESIKGVNAICALIDQTYHFQFVIDSRQYREHLDRCAQIASKVSLYRVRRPPGKQLSKEFWRFLRGHFI